MKRKKKFEMTANKFGIMVKKCCASCAHKNCDEQGLRCCQKSGKHVRGNKVCECWEMSEGLNALGSGERGKVQCRRYQLYMMEVRDTEREFEAQGIDVGEASLASVRKDYTLKYGERYDIR